MRETAGLNLPRCSSPDTQVLISVGMFVGNKSNNDVSEGLSQFEWRFRVLVQRFVLNVDVNNSRGYLLLSASPHPIFW